MCSQICGGAYEIPDANVSYFRWEGPCLAQKYFKSFSQRGFQTVFMRGQVSGRRCRLWWKGQVSLLDRGANWVRSRASLQGEQLQNHNPRSQDRSQTGQVSRALQQPTLQNIGKAQNPFRSVLRRTQLYYY